MRVFLAFVLMMSALPLPSARAAVKVERVEYHGWKECWKLSNGTVDLVYVPSIGRIMRYGYVGKPNVLWEKPEMQGKLPDPNAKDWQNFGGDKLWPAPQSVWVWPPYHDVDPGSHEVKLIRKGTLLVVGKPSAKAGVRFEREITMDDKGSGVRIVNRMVNTSDKPQKWAVWEIAQIDDPDSTYIPLSSSNIHPNRYYAFPDNLPQKRSLTVVRDQYVDLSRDKSKSAKIGSYSERAWVRCMKGATCFEMRVEGVSELHKDQPDEGCTQEVYTSPDPDTYVEMELLGGVRELRPGESASLVLKWRLVPVGVQF